MLRIDEYYLFNVALECTDFSTTSVVLDCVDLPHQVQCKS